MQSLYELTWRRYFGGRQMNSFFVSVFLSVFYLISFLLEVFPVYVLVVDVFVVVAWSSVRGLRFVILVNVHVPVCFFFRCEFLWLAVVMLLCASCYGMARLGACYFSDFLWLGQFVCSFVDSFDVYFYAPVGFFFLFWNSFHLLARALPVLSLARGFFATYSTYFALCWPSVGFHCTHLGRASLPHAFILLGCVVHGTFAFWVRWCRLLVEFRASLHWSCFDSFFVEMLAALVSVHQGFAG